MSEVPVLTVELKVLVNTNDERVGAADRIEAQVRCALAVLYPSDSLYVEQVVAEHQAGWR